MLALRSLVGVAALFASGTLAAQASSSLPLAETVMCVYPMSSHYGVLNRCLVYACLLITMVGWKLNWAMTVSAAWACLASSVAAVHIWVIVGLGDNQPVVDLDILAAWILVTASLMMWNGILTFSQLLKSRRARPIVMIWALFLAPAPIAFLAGGPKALRKIRAYAQAIETACYNPHGTLLTSPAQLWRNDSSWNCTYSCFSAKPSLLRDADEVIIIRANLASFLPKYLIAGSVLALAAAAFGFYAVLGGHRAAGRYFFNSGEKAPLGIFRTYKNPYEKDNSPVIPGSIPPAQRREHHTGFDMNNITAQLTSTVPLSVLFTLLTIPLVIFTEVAFAGYDGSSTLPSDNVKRSINQWYPWVGFGLALIAGMFTPVVDYMNKYWF